MYKKTVLIVDDSECICEVLSETINKEPDMETIGECYDVDSAISFISTSNPDIILLDLIFPQKSGIEVLNHINKLNNKPIVIVMSSILNSSNISRFVYLPNVNGLLFKPFKLSYMVEYIRSCISANE